MSWLRWIVGVGLLCAGFSCQTIEFRMTGTDADHVPAYRNDFYKSWILFGIFEEQRWLIQDPRRLADLERRSVFPDVLCPHGVARIKMEMPPLQMVLLALPELPILVSFQSHTIYCNVRTDP